MKKIITILLVSLMVLTLTACNKKQEETVVEEPTVQEVVKQEEPKKEETVTPIPEVKEEATVVEEVTKEDTVDVTTLSYWVNFLNYDGTVISRKAYKYGETPVYPTSPEYFDGVAYYAFREWDKKLSPVHMTQTYKALYDVTGYVYHEEAKAPAQTGKDDEPVYYTIYHLNDNTENPVYSYYKIQVPTNYDEDTTLEDVCVLYNLNDKVDEFNNSWGDVFGGYAEYLIPITQYSGTETADMYLVTLNIVFEEFEVYVSMMVYPDMTPVDSGEYILENINDDQARIKSTLNSLYIEYVED